MKVSLSWLKELVAFSSDVEDIAESLSMSGFEVEELNDLSSSEGNRVKEMSNEWKEWAKVSNVLPWPVDPNVMAKRLEGDHSHIHQHRGPTAGQIAEGKGKFL